MSQESHQRFLAEGALRSAKKMRAEKGEGATVRDFLAERIQTVEPWKRICCAAIGLVAGAMAYWLAFSSEESRLAACGLGVFAVFAVCVAVIGWKRPVESVIDGVAELVSGILG